MYLGIPSLTLFKINQEYRNGVSKGEVDDVVLAERFFRYWYNQKKRLGWFELSIICSHSPKFKGRGQTGLAGKEGEKERGDYRQGRQIRRKGGI